MLVGNTLFAEKTINWLFEWPIIVPIPISIV